jgi:hypothetical protein
MDLFDELVQAGFDMCRPVAIIRMLPARQSGGMCTFLDATIGIINCGVIIAPDNHNEPFECSTYDLIISTGLPGEYAFARIPIGAHSTLHHSENGLYLECDGIWTCFNQDEESIQTACEIKVALSN